MARLQLPRALSSFPSQPQAPRPASPSLLRAAPLALPGAGARREEPGSRARGWRRCRKLPFIKRTPARASRLSPPASGAGRLSGNLHGGPAEPHGPRPASVEPRRHTQKARGAVRCVKQTSPLGAGLSDILCLLKLLRGNRCREQPPRWADGAFSERLAF